MSRVLDVSKVNAALKRAAEAGVSGPLVERAGRFDLEQRYVTALGEQDGKIVATLICDYLELRNVWRIYSALFESDKKTVDLLNWIANETFGVIQEELQKTLIIRIYKFFDKPSDALSFKRLSTSQQNRWPLIGEAERAVKGKFQDWRHEQVVHKNLSVALQRSPPKAKRLNGSDMRVAIEKIGAALSSIHNSCSPGVELAWPQFSDVTDGLKQSLQVAYDVELKLKDGLELQR
jgi:hypothetical protein